MADPDLRDSVIDVLGEAVVPLEEVRDRLGPPWSDQHGQRDALARLVQRDGTFVHVTAGHGYRPALLEGTRWTVWVDADDADQGFVRMHPDLDALGWWLIEMGVPLTAGDGRELGAVSSTSRWLDEHDTDIVIGPDGWLGAVRGRFAEFSVVSGTIRVSPLDGAPAPTPAQLDAVRDAFARLTADPDRGRTPPTPRPAGLRTTGLAEIVQEASAVDVAAFREARIPPSEALCAAAGLEIEGDQVGAPGTDWAALHRWQTANRLRIMTGLDAAQAAAAAALIEITTAEELPPALELAALDDGAVADVWWTEVQRAGVGTDQIGAIADAADPAGGIGATWLQARAAERTGDAAAAEAALVASVDDACTHGPALLDLAGFRADRGDAPGALALVRRAGVATSDDEDDPADRGPAEMLRDEVEGFALHRPPAMARRNDPCPCGSGRKYKACHQGREAHPLDDRAGWLYQKALRFFTARQPLAVHNLCHAVLDIDAPRLAAEALQNSPVLADVLLHEGGAFREFIDTRGALLPTDEADLAHRWARTGRAVLEVLDASETRLRLRDDATGEMVRVVNVHGTSSLEPGMMLVGRPLPVGDAYRSFSGFMYVPFDAVDAVADAVASGDTDRVARAIAHALTSLA